MEYKYKGKNTVLVSSNGALKHVKQNETIDFSDEDIKSQPLNDFVQVEAKEEKKIKKKVKESDE